MMSQNIAMILGADSDTPGIQLESEEGQGSRFYFDVNPHDPVGAGL